MLEHFCKRTEHLHGPANWVLKQTMKVFFPQYHSRIKTRIWIILCFADEYGIPEADIFIPQALEGSREEKKKYKEFLQTKLIPALKSNDIRFVDSCQ